MSIVWFNTWKGKKPSQLIGRTIINVHNDNRAIIRWAVFMNVGLQFRKYGNHEPFTRNWNSVKKHYVLLEED